MATRKTLNKQLSELKNLIKGKFDQDEANNQKEDVENHE
jgi:hypothetical protein